MLQLSVPIRRTDYLLLFSVLTVVCAAYWRTLLLPFIQDDFGLLRFAQSTDIVTALQTIFRYAGRLFYRPLGQTYVLAMYKIFGPNPIPFHVAALTIHIANSCLVAFIINAIIRNKITSYLTALIYASAIAIHVDPLAWAVGIYDIGAAFFVFLSIWLFITNRLVSSAFAYFLGCLFKESAVVLPVILFAYAALMSPVTGWQQTIRSHWKRVIPFLLAMFVIGTIKVSGESPLTYPTTHPYAMDLGHAPRNALKYLCWMLQSFLPFSSFEQNTLRPSIIGVILVLWGTLARHSRESGSRRIFLLAVWAMVGLLPVILFSNHTYRYYATYSLPALVGCLLYASRRTLESFGIGQAATSAILVFFSCFAVAGSVIQANRIYLEGLNQRTLADGTNALIRRAAVVSIVQDGLKQYVPTPPRGAVILIGSADLWSFDKDRGLQFWYDDGSIHVYALDELKTDNGRAFIENPVEDQGQAYTGGVHKRVFLDPSRVFAFRVSEGRLIAVDLEQITQPR